VSREGAWAGKHERNPVKLNAEQLTRLRFNRREAVRHVTQGSSLTDLCHKAGTGESNNTLVIQAM